EKAGLLSGKDSWNTLNISRLNIESIRMSDGPHGLRKQYYDNSVDDNESIPATCFPPATTVACSFNKEIAYIMGEAIARECLSEKVDILLAPGINIKRNPLCGRNFEYFSEDPYLTSQIAMAFIKGVQSKGVGVCLKHYAANSQEAYRFSNDSIVDKRSLNEIYLYSFRKIIEELDIESVMCSYNMINGIYSCENKYLLNDLLREEWNFKGIVVSDWGATNDRVESLKAGLDLEMPSSKGLNDKKIVDAVINKQLSEDVINTSVERILNLQENFKKKIIDSFPLDKIENHNIAYEVAKESFVLLKNDNILPLNVDDDFVIIGDLAKNPHIQGWGSSRVNPTYINNTFYELKKRKEGIKYSRGYSDIPEECATLVSQAVKLAKEHKIILLFIGLTDEYESEGADRISLKIPNNQYRLLEELYKVNKNIVVILNGGGVLNVEFLEHTKAILYTLLPGQAGSRAVVDMLFGDVNPSGKLAESCPKKICDIPSYKFYPGGSRASNYLESIYVGYRYYDTYNIDVRFPFGYGLSYTNFQLSNFSINKQKDKFIVELDIENTGNYSGSEVVQLYVRNKTDNTFFASQELKKFEKIFLKINEKRHLSMDVEFNDLMYFDFDSDKFELATGNYEVAIGTSSRDIKHIFKLEIQGSKTEKVFIRPKSYHEHTQFNNDDFKLLINSDVIPPQNKKISRPFTFNTSLKEMRKTMFGKILHSLVTKNIKENAILNEESASRQADYVTFRTMVLLGGFSYYKAEAILHFMNREIFKGILSLFKKERKDPNGKE
ncbi:MAG: glycoside hydrolase family 3 C-terminal domain-containing protein, partial [Bacilli bacterium]|nr:glycoside hydrolase family 3 C-terminal domain-containing protein [Bacilli bacterium]